MLSILPNRVLVLAHQYIDPKTFSEVLTLPRPIIVRAGTTAHKEAVKQLTV